MMTTRILILAALGGLLISGVGHAETYTYPQLVERMTDLQGLAKLPPTGEKTSLASSYDRHSKYDATTDKYIAWDANGDGNFGGPELTPMEGDKIVMADIKGPGCIWRTWSAGPGGGHVRIYLDGSATPMADLPFISYFDGKTPPFNRPNIVYQPQARMAGRINYTPISFAKSCKILADKNWGNYFQFTYTTFPEGAVVPTFSMNLSAEDSATLDQADKILGQCGQNPTADTAETQTESPSITVPAGQRTIVADLSGAGAITTLKVKLDLPSDLEAQRLLLNQLTLSITWDDETAPAVWSPLGDFFGYVPGGLTTFQSLPVGLLPDGTFYSYWYMPYGRKAHIEVGNVGTGPVSMAWQVTHAPLEQPIETLARFHAKWHRDAFLPTRPDRAPDWTLLTTQGTGRYVGTHLHVWNPGGGWWGEGDDKFFVDGEKFPSSFGTGSEDYFGYSWCWPDPYSRPYHDQVIGDNNAGNVDDNRWHIPDSVPFQTSLEANIEKYWSNARPTLYAAEAFWYLKAGGADPYTSIPSLADREFWRHMDAYHEPNAIEGGSLTGAAKSTGSSWCIQEMQPFGKEWSNDEQLFWQPNQAGSTLELTLPAQKAGKYHLIAVYTESGDYGTIQANLNGTDVGQPTDLYATTVKTTDPIDLGIVTLPEGQPVFKVTITGKNPASNNYYFGLDYLKLVPVP